MGLLTFHSIREALLILDCYRVVLLQRPPSTPSRCLFDSQAESVDRQQNRTDDLPNIISAILLKRPFHGLTRGSPESLSSLAYLGLLTWSLVPQPTSRLPGPQSLWSGAFCESCLHQWRLSHIRPADENILMLFHAIHLNTVVCIPDLQTLVVKYLMAQKSPRNEPVVHTGPTTHGCQGLSMDTLRVLFRSDQDREKSVWHARKMLSLSEYIIRIPPSAASRVQSPRGPSNKLEPPRKAPHFAHCVSFSVLTLWCESLLTNELNVHESKSWLERGIKVLVEVGTGSSHIEAQFRDILRDLHRCAVGADR